MLAATVHYLTLSLSQIHFRASTGGVLLSMRALIKVQPVGMQADLRA